MIEHYLKCDSCGRKQACYENNKPKKVRKGMIFLNDIDWATSNANHIGYSTQRGFRKLFFCNHKCLRVFLNKELGE